MKKEKEEEEDLSTGREASFQVQSCSLHYGNSQTTVARRRPWHMIDYTPSTIRCLTAAVIPKNLSLADS